MNMKRIIKNKEILMRLKWFRKYHKNPILIIGLELALKKANAIRDKAIINTLISDTSFESELPF